MIPLTILIPSIPERIEHLTYLLGEIYSQDEKQQCEVIVLMDNCKRSIGKKRTDLLQLAQGKYLTMLDDDDDIAEDFIPVILEAIKDNSDVITFKQDASINGEPFTVSFGLKNENEEAHKEGEVFADITRKAWHCCVWKREVVKGCFFSDTNYGEDAIFSDNACKNAISETHIDKVMHFYNFNSETTRAK